MEPNKLSIQFLCTFTEEFLEFGRNDIFWKQKLNVKKYNLMEKLLEIWIHNLWMVFYQNINFEKKIPKPKYIIYLALIVKKTLCRKKNLRQHLEWHFMKIENIY
jgi:hypothetical protein